MAIEDDVISEIAERHGLGRGAVSAARQALARGNGTMAQFSHAEFGGMAQWSKAGCRWWATAFFPSARRLIVDDADKRTTYDTSTHMISGVSQQQSNTRSLKFQSQDCDVRLEELVIVE